MTKKFYNQPEVSVAQLEAMNLMQVSDTESSGVISFHGGSTTKQW